MIVKFFSAKKKVKQRLKFQVRAISFVKISVEEQCTNIAVLHFWLETSHFIRVRWSIGPLVLRKWVKAEKRG